MRRAPQEAVAIAVAAPRRDQRGDAVRRRVPRRHPHRLGVDVAGIDAAAPGLGGGDGEDAGARAHVEHAPPLPPPRDAVEREQAAARRRMLAGAEGGGGIDDQPDAPGRYAARVMRAVDEIAPGRERREARLVLGQPVALGHALDRYRRRRRAAPGPGQRHYCLDQRCLRLLAGETLDLPALAGRRPERAHRRAGRAERRRRAVRARRIRRPPLVMPPAQRALAFTAPSPVDRCAVATLSRMRERGYTPRAPESPSPAMREREGPVLSLSKDGR